MKEITRIFVKDHYAHAELEGEILASIHLHQPDAVELLARRLGDLGYSSRQIVPSPAGDKLLIRL
jgi:hypothetical protein